MKAVAWAAIGAVAGLLVGLVAVAAVAPSCEDRGGESEFSHVMPICSKTCVLVPQYDCRFPPEVERGP